WGWGGGAISMCRRARCASAFIRRRSVISTKPGSHRVRRLETRRRGVTDRNGCASRKENSPDVTPSCCAPPGLPERGPDACPRGPSLRHAGGLHAGPAGGEDEL